MGDRLARLARIAPGELRLAGALFGVMLATSAGAGAGATAADALLFARAGTAALPELYLALGVVSLIFALGVSVVFGAVRRERVYPISLGVLIATLFVLRLVVAGGADLAYPVVWLGANVIVMLQGVVAWGVASALCDARQAKRLFPLANAAKIAGAIAGAAAVAPLLLVFRLEDLLLLWAAALGVTLVVVVRVTRGTPTAAVVIRTTSLRDEIVAGFRIVRASPLLRALAMALVLFSVLFFALALPFVRGARAAMPREDDLAAFLGVFNATATGAAFVASLVVANRFYARFGVVNAIFGLTLIYLAGFGALALTDSFVVIAAARWLQLAWLAGMADAAYQALFNPVPAGRRDQMRAFMEGVPGQAGIALAGLLLILGDRALDERQVAMGGAAAAALTAAVIWRTRGAYRDALVAALRAGRPEPFLGARQTYASLLADRAALGVVREGLASPDATVRRASAQILGEMGTAESRDALLEAARDADALVRASAFRGGARIDARAFADAARAASGDAEPEPRVAALLVLERSGDARAAMRLRAEASDAAPSTRLVAAHAIARSTLSDAPEVLERLAGDADAVVRHAAIDGLVTRDPQRALELASALLADRTRQDDALRALEAMPAAPATAAVREYASGQRERAVRYADLAAAVPDDGDATALLRDALVRRSRAAARRAVRAAAIISGREAPAAVLDGLESAAGPTRAEALEGLEACVRADLARTLIPIWEGARTPRPLSDLRDDDDDWLRACGAALVHGGDDMSALLTIPLMERVLFLHRVPLFASLDPADLQQVARIATERGYADGETVFRRGERGDALAIVLDGALRIVQDGREVARRGRGEVVGEMSIVSDAPRIADAVAQGETRTLRIARADFEAILRDRPDTALGVIRVLAARLAEATAVR